MTIPDGLGYSFLMPPALFVLLALVSAVIALRWRSGGNVLVLGSTISLYLLSTPLISVSLLQTLETQVPEIADLAGAQAIVVLSATIHHGDGGRIPDTVGALTLERLEHAAVLQRELGLPILVTGGPIGGSQEPVARLMQDVLEGAFGIPVRWREERAGNTFENARNSAEILRASGIRCAIVVTHPWHMPRTLWSFAQVGMSAVPSSTARTYGTDIGKPALGDLLPQARSMHESFFALHEMLGLLAYRFYYRAPAPENAAQPSCAALHRTGRLWPWLEWVLRVAGAARQWQAEHG